MWFARGGYGSNRIAEAALVDLPQAARGKTYFGYSDAGFLLAGFYKSGLSVAWGPMPQDVVREGGDAAINRALDWLVRRDLTALEPDLKAPAMAFNLTVLSNLLGTPLEPDFTGVDLLIEDVSEHLYRIDRTMFHVTASPNIRRVAAAAARAGRRYSAKRPGFRHATKRRLSRTGAAVRASLTAAAPTSGTTSATESFHSDRFQSESSLTGPLQRPSSCALSKREQQEGRNGTRRT